MTPAAAIVDTDVLSAIMRRHVAAVARAQTYLAFYSRLSFSIITRFEILRGLEAKQATAQIAAFHRFCANSEVLPLTDSIVMRATSIYGDLHRRGQVIGDADILIAATALEHGLIIVTNNEAHFRRIPGVQIENWLTA